MTKVTDCNNVEVKIDDLINWKAYDEEIKKGDSGLGIIEMLDDHGQNAAVIKILSRHEWYDENESRKGNITWCPSKDMRKIP